MAPAPITIIDFGCVGSVIALRYSMMRSPSMVTPGMLRARAPVATMMCLAVRARSPTVSVPLPVSFAVPTTCAILFLRNRNATPFEIFSETSRLRLTIAARSGRTVPSRMIPNSWARWNSSRTSAERSSALVGMQPQLRQMPPSSARSTHAVLRPSWAARMAAT
jgi:hypothetical protein